MTENLPTVALGQGDENPLESWKEIAAYLKRGVRTVKRWENSEGLPVHRHMHKSRSSVYAYPSELDAWWAKRPPAEEAAPESWFLRPARAMALAAALLLALLTTGDGRLLGPPNIAAQTQGITTRQVWAGADADPLGAPSPDGRHLSFVDWETGDLAVRDMVTGNKRRLTNKGTWSESTAFALFSTVSPDGKQVAYAWFTNDLTWELRAVGIDGSGSHVLYRGDAAEYVQPDAWSPDGKYLLVLLARADRTHQIALVSVADGSLRVLKTLDWRSPTKMSLSPDGRYIVYDFPPTEESPQRDIFLLASDGDREIPLVKHPANDVFPVWTPDGKNVIFASDRTGTTGLWGIPIANGRPQGPPELIKPDVGRFWPIGFTQKGSLFYGLDRGLNDVYVATLDLTTGKVVEAPTAAGQRFVGSNSAPDWSPDGTLLAFISQRSPLPANLGSRVITIRNLATGQERDMVPDLNSVRRPRWSPDGSTILVSGSDRKNRSGIYRIDVQTSEVSPMVQAGPGVYFQWATWSPDGKTVFYQRDDGPKKTQTIVVRDLHTGQERSLYAAVGPVFINGFGLSLDGQQLVFRRIDQTTKRHTLMLMPVAGGEPRLLYQVEPPSFIPGNSTFEWTADGKEVQFVMGTETPGNLEEQTWDLWRVRVETGEARKCGFAMDRLRDVRLHPDGKRITFTAGRGKSEIWVLENFLPTPRAAK